MNIDFIITSLIVVLIPGTGVIFTISTGLFQGSKASIFAALGCTVGIVPHLLASIFGLATILHMSAVTFQAIKFIGVAYLLYLAWSMWKETTSFDLEEKNQGINYWGICLKAILLNILNPKLSLFFLAFLPQFIPAGSESPAFDMLLLSSVFMAMTFFIFILYGLFANKVSTYVIHSSKVIKNTQKTFAVFFALLAAKLAITER